MLVRTYLHSNSFKPIYRAFASLGHRALSRHVVEMNKILLSILQNDFHRKLLEIGQILGSLENLTRCPITQEILRFEVGASVSKTYWSGARSFRNWMNWSLFSSIIFGANPMVTLWNFHRNILNSAKRNSSSGGRQANAGVIGPGPEFADIPQTRQFPLPDHECVGGEAYHVPSHLPSPLVPITFLLLSHPEWVLLPYII